MNKSFLNKMLIRGFLFGVVLMVASGCGGGGKADVQPPVTPASQGEPSCYLNGQTVTGAAATTCCDSSGSPKASLPAQCPQAPGFNGSKSAINGFVNSAVAGRTALSSADGMVGNSGTAGLVGSSAATAADSLARQANRPAKSAAMNVPQNGAGSGTSAQLGSNSPQGGGGGAASGGGSGGGNLSALGAGVSTDPAAAPAQPALSSSGADGTAGAYAGSGGGQAAKGAAAAGFGSLFGANGESQGSRAQDSIDQGRNPASNTSLSQDPADYFDMHKPTDNIFKIVERRYTEKAENWARGNAAAASHGVKKLSK